MRAWIAAVALALLPAAAPAAAPPRAPTALDRIAEDYVHLTLEMGEREPGYVDAYYGPKAWAEAAKAHPRAVATLAADAAALGRRLGQVDRATLAPIDRRRAAFLAAQLTAARTRMAMAGGAKLPFVDEAEGLFAVRPALKPLSAFDPVLARIASIVPGDGPLAERVDAFNARYTIPPARIEPVMRAAIAECRARTLRHIALPPAETFRLELVKNKPWSGYNWYEGRATSLIQINTDLPIPIGRAIDLGCHEGYPGHHALNMLLERDLAVGRGWIEFTVYPLFSPQSLIAEGSANYGIDLAFPGDEAEAFEARTLYPLAGLDPRAAPAYDALRKAMKELAGARMTIAQMYLDGRIDREKAIALTRTYGLVSRAKAEQGIRFDDTYRSYVINYGLGQEMVRAHVEAAGADAAARWRAMARVISEPTLPADLTGAR
ncbi:hypothetical protein [Sphingomonas profundi]|uniref:hypothetical protein n=1 Tax=Alterirhizorhabdus profundi TaxID=2681549 RepID=UPI001E5F9EC1|nr:hypothetical protein [Sphingomonas profundi]